MAVITLFKKAGVPTIVFTHGVVDGQAFKRLKKDDFCKLMRVCGFNTRIEPIDLINVISYTEYTKQYKKNKLKFCDQFKA